ncbi:MAG: sensor domain-containing diguanylate cyclase [Deltaproteobacteria bacterium]|nr:sensor domain-containing diguanylate cyclase [Candidatus Anaeroferrophillus wilburensis]MBN2890080.1 sensor domain-containing diguanylate cyclase [Deltaproteobacteria bacterium]
MPPKSQGSKNQILNEDFFHRFAELGYTWESWYDPAGNYLYVSPACERISGYSPDEFYQDSQLMERIIDPKFRNTWRNHIHKRLVSGELERLDLRIITKNGDERWIGHYCQTIYDHNGQILGTRSTNTDITIRKQTEDALEKAARLDPLTGILNRRAFIRRLDDEKIRFLRNNRPFCLVMADIDFFKEVNDTYGHSAGDHILVQLANLMTTTLRSQDSISRWGGEEFLFLLPETDLHGGIYAADKLRSLIEIHDFSYEQHHLSITVSFGISVYQEGMTIDDCLRKADDNLYLAKRKGRNQVVS